MFWKVTFLTPWWKLLPQLHDPSFNLFPAGLYFTFKLQPQVLQRFSCLTAIALTQVSTAGHLGAGNLHLYVQSKVTISCHLPLSRTKQTHREGNSFSSSQCSPACISLCLPQLATQRAFLQYQLSKPPHPLVRKWLGHTSKHDNLYKLSMPSKIIFRRVT